MTTTTTRQEIFDTVVRNLHAQGRPAVNSKGHCEYRTADGCKCAVGGLIPDDKYTTAIEGKRVYADVVQEVLPSELRDHVSFLGYLQAAHDSHWVTTDPKGGERTITPDRFVRELNSIAQHHQLDPAVIRETFEKTA
jgi:hypothetical protein